MDAQILSQKIKEGFGGDTAYDSAALDTYSHDASLFEVKPLLIVFPKDAADIEFLVNFVKKNKKTYPNLSITPRSAGTDMSGGALGEGIIADFSRYFNKTPSINKNIATT